MIVIPVSGSEEATESGGTTALQNDCPCGCGISLAQVEWKKYDPNNAALESGHYYLDGNYVQKDQYNISSENRLVLDLRGYALTTKEYGRLYKISGYLAVLDSVGGGKLSSKTAGNGYGGVVMMTKEDTTAVFELYSGTLTADKDNKGSRRGGLISVGGDSVFRMYDGMIMNGTSSGEKEEAGGCIAATAASSVVEILGGTVIGGYAPSHGGNIYSSNGTTILKNCKIIGGRSAGNGGNIFQSGGKLTVDHCVIADGVSTGTYGGGNIGSGSSAEIEIRNSVIRNGYAAKQGGNIYFASGNQVLIKTTVEAGVAGTYGGNLRLNDTSVATLQGCSITGDVVSTGRLTLAGTTKIGLNNNGLNLIFNGVTVPVHAAGLTEGAEIYVNAGGRFTDSGANGEYFKPALRTVITQTAEGLVGTQAAEGELAGYCPHCMEQVAWSAFDTTACLAQECLLDGSGDTDSACTGRHMATGHYYLTQSYTSFSQMYAGASVDGNTMSADVVIDLNGNSITASGRAFYIKPTTPASTLSLLDSAGGAVVTGKGAADQGGGVIYSEKGNLNIYGGKYVFASGKAVNNGGVIYAGGITNIYGGILDASAYSRTGYNGGVLYQSSGAAKKLTVTAGRFVGGRAKNGGTVYIYYNSSAEITGGQFAGGSVTNTGGNIYAVGTEANSKGTVRISNASITDGQADTYGGNLHITYFENAKVENTYISRGNADDYAGNVALGTNTTFAEYENCTITDGTAKRGANLYSYGLGSRARLTNCTILGGVATTHGGNLSAVNGYIEIVGGVLADGTAGTNGGNINATIGNNEKGKDNYLCLTGGVRLTGGSANDCGNLRVAGVVVMENAFLHNGTAKNSGQDIGMVKGTLQSVFTVGEEAFGTVSMYISEALMGTDVYGSTVAGTAATRLKMQITLEGDYGEPQLCVRDGMLAVASACVEGAEDWRWYATATEAAATCNSGEYVTLYADSVLELTKDAYVDLNGKTLTVTGEHTLYGMDNTGDAFALPTGKVEVTGQAKIGEVFRNSDGRTYVAVMDADTATFHRLDMAITGAAIRSSVSGIYYTGTWRYDEVLAQKLKTCGIAVSTVAALGDDFMADDVNLWTVLDVAEITSGGTGTSAIISGILKTAAEGRTAEQNNIYGKTSVFAAAYVTLNSGTVLTGTSANQSLYSIMKQLEELTDTDPNTYSRYLLPAQNFYESWKDFGMGDWDLSKIPGKADDGVLDILFFGNSLTYYGKCLIKQEQTVHSLEKRKNDQGYFYQICKNNGIEASVTNFCFGGHKLEDFYSHSCQADRGHDGLDHLAYLTDRNYDYVVLQESTRGEVGEDILAECQPLMDMFLEVNPETKFVFLVTHRVHCTDLYPWRTNIKDLEEAGIIVVDWGGLVYDVMQGNVEVPGATQSYNQNSLVIRKSEDDGLHQNMLAGYITAQMLYCAITGESAVGQDYSFCGDTSVNKAFDFEKFLKEEYSYDSATSNFIEIFNSPSDMLGLQMLMDQYLAEKTWLNY